MKKVSLREPATWSTVLLVTVVFTVFFVALFPFHMHRILYKVFFAVIYFAGILNMVRHRRQMLAFTILVIILDWLSVWLDAPALLYVSRPANIIFFLFIVGSLIHQVARAKSVSAKVILEAINGYLLVGLIFAIMVGIIGQFDATAFSFHERNSQGTLIATNFSEDLYFTFITLATVGYGDMLPLKPFSRALATLIGIFGQLYIAIIIAMLVGKYASQRKDN
jgi:hypothetical protein